MVESREPNQASEKHWEGERPAREARQRENLEKALAANAEELYGRLSTRKVYRTRDAARADVFDYIERFYNTIRRHSTNGYLSPVEFERKVGLA